MEKKIYPNLQKMCRLCLKENTATVCIFPKEKNSDKFAALSIPMRIMTCAALEVQDAEDFPTKICSDCRLQLEKSYLFRKQSQASDAKLRKHLRLIAMGKTSKVFNKKSEEDDDDDDELELQDSMEFIKEQEDNQKQIEKLKFDRVINEIKQQNEEELKKIKENLRVKCREELVPEIREQLRNELRLEVENELEESLRKEISEQCINEAKEKLRSEVQEECRQIEVKSLLGDLQTFLNNKKKSLDTDEIAPKDIAANKRPLSPSAVNKEPVAKRKFCAPNASNIEELDEEDLNSANVEKAIIINEQELNTKDEECDSEGNFLIYDTDDGGIDVQKKPSEDREEYNGNNIVAGEDYEYIDSSCAIAYEKVNEENMDTNDEESGETKTTTTSYRIEDNENGEIKFLQRSNDNNDEADEENLDQGSESIMIIDFPESLDNEYVGQFEEVKYVKAKKQLKTKSKKSPGKKSITRSTTSTLETTVLTKTYVNPMQRSTDTPKTFKCDDCPMVFSTKPSLERHLRTHRKVEKSGVTFQCPECQIVVSCSSALRRHMYVHCEVKPFACDVCDKAFVQREILKRHMQTHTGIRPHQCPQCDRSFAQRINLTQHINRTHLDEPRIQQHACHLCPKRFNHASGLSRHLASHSGVAFQCSECDRTFGDRSSVKRHIINTHGNLKPKNEVKAKTP